MRNLIIVLIVISSTIMYNSCTTNADNADSRTKITTINKQFELVPDKSKIDWTRFVDNKKVEKTIRLFGNDTKVTMENVQFNTEGTLDVKKGDLLMTDNKWVSGDVELDFTAVRLWSEEEQKYFATKEFPASQLKIESFENDTTGKDNYILNCTLSILDSTKAITIPAEITTDSLGLTLLKGVYKLQTLDWPLKENNDRKKVRKDEFTLNLELYFENTKSDTSVVYQ